ncbi:MAG: glycoside hydrolase family 3 protein, partial [Propionibacteriaceae bacterium]|nr:glycoside hydrolase family 3 protein [Propionibacteriaceae bacterium]
MPDESVLDLPLLEKANLLSGDGDWHTHRVAGLVPAAELSDGPHGLRTETGVDMVWIPSTGFPTGSALGSSWDVDLAGRVGRAIGEEARAMGVHCVLGPGVNLKRTPLCGRNFEYFSEDPALTAQIASSWIQGLQSAGVSACLKHFAANNQETERTEISVEAEETVVRELYLEGFRRIVADAGPWAVMCSYNRIWGVHASQHRWLLTRVLREEWGFDGLVISDWDAVHDPVAAVAAGLDLEMPGTGGR